MTKILLSSLLIFFFINTHAANLVDESELSKLAQSRTWIKLMYFDQALGESDVISAEYFLAHKGRYDPLAELKATLDAYDQPFSDEPNNHPVCKFPARYFWLNQTIGLDRYQKLPPQCTHLIKSYSNTQVDSISFMFVTGFLGNPASSFGHSFIKMNNHNALTESDLFDLSISYGANVPENENMFMYVYRGLFGKYDSTFKDKYFYTKDLVYTSSELRDIWEYELILPPEKVDFLKLHSWEILGQKFRYIFLNKNCGYQVSRFLEVSVDEELAKNASYWFAPIESFHALAESQPPEKWIKQIKYHPSEQRQIYQHFESLTRQEQQVVIELVESDLNDVSPLNGLSDPEQIHAINFVIAYYKYQLIGDSKNQQLLALKKKALLQRLSLPVKRQETLVYQNLEPPHENDKPTMLFTHWNYESNQANHLSIGFTPYAVQTIGRNNLKGDELVALKGELAATDKKAFLKRFDVINIKRFDRYRLPLEESLNVSWQLDLAVENVDIEKEKYDVFANVGLGKSWLPSDWLMGYFMLNGSLHSYADPARVSPQLGSRWGFGDAKALLTLQKDYGASGFSDWQLEMKSSVRVAKDSALYAGVLYKEDWKASVGLQLYY